MFDVLQLRCFIAVAEELHFGRAALRLNMTQPPLSRQIQILERVLGVKLLERTSRSVDLTLAGRGFLPQAKRIHRMIEHASVTVRRVALGEEGALSLGFTAATGYSYLPRFIKHLRGIMPAVDLTLHEMVSNDQIEALLAGELDVGLLRPPFHRHHFASHRVLLETLVVAVPIDSLYDAGSIRSIADLRGLPLLMYSPVAARYFHDLLMTRLHAVDVAPDIVQFVSQIHSMLALVGAGLGLALVPEGAERLHIDGVRYIHLAPEAAIPVELFLAWRVENENPALIRLASQRADLPS